MFINKKIGRTIAFSLLSAVIVVSQLQGMIRVRGNVDPNQDNCIVNSENATVVQGRSLSTVFVERNGSVREGNNGDLNGASRNVYEVIERPSLYQRFSGPCGLYSSFNLFRLKGNMREGRAYFDRNLSGWQRRINHHNLRQGVQSNDIQTLLDRLLRGKNKNNVSISFCDPDASNRRVVSHAHTLDGGSMRAKIRAFRQGTSQYLVISSKGRDRLQCLDLTWDNRNGRKRSLRNHWLVIKLSWHGRAMRSAVRIETLDSGNPRDNRFAADIHWYYYLFARSNIVAVNAPAIRYNAPRNNQPRMNQQPQRMMMNQPQRNNQPRMNQQPQRMMMNQPRRNNQPRMNQQPQRMMMNQPQRNNQPRMMVQQPQQMMQQPRRNNQPRMMVQQPQQMMQLGGQRMMRRN